MISTDALLGRFPLFVNEESSLTIVNEGSSLTIVKEGSSLTIANEGSSLTIVNEGSSLTIVNEGSSLTIVNDGSSLTIVNETTSFIKRPFFTNELFKITIVSFSIFCHRFHNETIVLKKNKNVNIPTCTL